MNHMVTSKETLLKTAFSIAQEEGISKISIRRVASECGVSIGSIYNYFPTKADLIVAVIEEFWKSAFHGVVWNDLEQESFPVFFAALYGRFFTLLTAFRSDWLEELSTLSLVEKQKGKASESGYFAHIQRGLLLALERDQSIPPEIWSRQFQKKPFTQFVFRNMLMMLQSGEDCAFFQETLKRLLYPPVKHKGTEKA